MNNGQKAAVGIGVAAGLGMVVYLLARPAKAAPPLHHPLLRRRPPRPICTAAYTIRQPAKE